jgi:hypothetical protein
VRRTIAALVTATAVAVAVTGCGSTQDAGPRAARAGAGLASPLSDAEQWRISDAQQRLIRECMSRKGFRYWEAERLSLEKSRTQGYVSDDVAWARKHGYGSRIRAEQERARRANPNAAYRQSLPGERRKAYDEALDEGVQAPVISAELPGGGTVRKRVGGCVAEAERQLYGDPETWFRAEKTAGSLQPFYVPQLMADKAFSAALAAWARCMERAGHPYKDPGAARQAALRQAQESGPAEAFETERKLAVADAGCAGETRLRSIGTERETHYVNKLRGRYGEELDTHARLQREALTRAIGIVGPRA